jgi:hypothetical protein
LLLVIRLIPSSFGKIQTTCLAGNQHPSSHFVHREKYEFLNQHNVFERVQRLSLPGNRHQYAERLDKDVLAASLAAEQKITRFGEPQWSLALAAAQKKAQVIQKQISMMKTGLENQVTIQHEWSTIACGELLPTSIRECSNLLRKHEKGHQRDHCTQLPAQRTRTSAADYVAHAFW